MSENKTFYLTTMTGRVIEDSTWSESRVSGSGGGSLPFGGNSDVKISTSVTTRQKLWIEQDDGRQTEVQLANSGFSCRKGHRVSFSFLRPKNTKDEPEHYHRALCFNHTTGESYHDVVGLKLAGSDARSGLFTLLLLVLPFIGTWQLNMGERHPEYMFGFFIMCVPTFILGAVASSRRRKKGMALLKEEEKRLSGMPLHRAEDVGSLAPQPA